MKTWLAALAAPLLALGLTLGLALPVTAQENAAYRQKVEAAFGAWLEGKVWPDAKKAGVSRATFEAAARQLSLDWSLPDLAPPGAPKKEEPQRQAEFSNPARYFDERKVDALMGAGRARIGQWQKTLADIEKRYGVPGRIVVAIWGRESGYGAAKIPYPAMQVLATEAFMGARKASFYPELIAGLKILEGEHIGLADMKSSWAGAMGQPQFMPSKYLEHAVDFDGDGRRDIWRSVPDTLASIANFLKHHGWKAGAGWGVEAVVPDSVSCALEGPEQGRPLAEWEAMGVAPAAGGSLSGKTPKRTAFLMMPAGRYGPAFIVSENFYVLKDYNNSDLYALFIGHVADRYGKGGPFSTGWEDPGPMKRSAVRAMQERLAARGVDVGKVDGLVGFKTRIAIGRWQEEHGERATCFPDTRLVSTIR